MITVKDFQGLTDAYVVRHCREDEPTITKCPIISVGRTYVTVQIDGWCEYKFRNLRGNDAFLTKLDDYKTEYRLFPTGQLAEQDLERDLLIATIQRAFEHDRKNQYTVDQLRAIEAIIEEV